MKKVTFGVIVTSRSFFPASLAAAGRKQVLEKLEKLGYGVVITPEEATNAGAIESPEDIKICAKLFKENSDIIDGILVILPNFGDEMAVAKSIKLSHLDVPVMVQASDDITTQMDVSQRRDSFCGKLSVCSNLYQRGIKFTNTSQHTCAIDSDEFTKDLEYFSTVCRIVKGVSTANLGMIGQRPNTFNTVRFSEKLLEKSGIHVSAVDLSEIISRAQSMENDHTVKSRIEEIKGYGPFISSATDENFLKQAKLSLSIDNWLKENDCVAGAVQCWTSIQENYGCASCLSMSMSGEKGIPLACETDITGSLTMYALGLATGNPAGYLDWNNNYDHQRDKCINIHCSNYPKSFMQNVEEIGNLDILGNALGEEKCFGALKGQVAAGNMTFAKISTDDAKGKIKMYVGEGEFTDDPVDTVGGKAVCKIENLQGLLDHLCVNGFEHHVAMVRGQVAKAVEEACGKYLGWDVYRHMG